MARRHDYRTYKSLGWFVGRKEEKEEAEAVRRDIFLVVVAPTPAETQVHLSVRILSIYYALPHTTVYLLSASIFLSGLLVSILSLTICVSEYHHCTSVYRDILG